MSDQKSPLPYFNEVPPPPPPPINPSFLTLPSPLATSPDIRQFLDELFRRRGLTADQAQTTASRWPLTASGRELRTYPVPAFRDAFGVEGWGVYKDVKGMVYREEGTEWVKGGRRGMEGEREGKGLSLRGIVFAIVFILAMLAVIAGGVVLIFLWGTTPYLAVPVVMITLGCTGIVLTIVWLSSGMRTRSKARLEPEERAERELIEQWGVGEVV